jgi:hypothetical protein
MFLLPLGEGEGEGPRHTMRMLLFIMGLYVVHRVLLSISPAYAQRMRRLDRQLTWMSLILVVYLLANALLRLLYYTR